ncbi:DUF1036 domain-containing protein [Mesorhizobium sp. BR-1-1-10]|uniref:DUF1036 domain-containing protein n=1 Tax=Mesorhizobium sp. BR-1-1-10 TaxID=2876660 RepID=UPI0015E3D807|nr:DUF1036 domain-containing protein [Mesorhizobium sp. BR-1-1-10]MBZ9973972.1 DUF1036 domain-containing protein [Mesorhizobium sp. BR-1-1-10]
MDLRALHLFCPPSARIKRSWSGRLLANRVAFSVLSGAALLLAVSTDSAHAEFTVCNQTLDVVNLAVGQKIDDSDQTDGWWTIGANQCVNVIREELTNRYVYLYATDVFGHAILSGSTEMCVDRHRFSIRGIDECWQRGHIAARFVEVDTLEQVRWTYFLTGNGP